jgi:hypothetical protein
VLHRLLPALVVVVVVAVAGCPTDLGAGKEGEEDTGGEGEAAEGEGEPAPPTPLVTLTTTPRYALPADGLSAFSLLIKLDAGDDGAPVAGRSIVVTTDPAGPDDVAAAVSDASGVVEVSVVSSVAGSFAVEVAVDGVVVPIAADRGGGVALEFTPCRSLEDTFLVDAWPVALSRCIGCHNEFGFAPSLGARFVLPLPGDEDFAAKGVAAVKNIMALTEADGLDLDTSLLDDEQRAALRLSPDEASLPLVLANPILGDVTGHTGGVVMSPTELEEVGRFRSFVARLQNGDDTCGAGSEHGLADENLLAGVVPLSPSETLKKATLTMTGAPASDAAVAAVDDEAGLAAALDAVLADPRSEQRMQEVWNDWLLTDQNLGDTPTYLGTSFPSRTFFERLQSEGARGGGSCDDSVAGNCCRIPEDPLNLDDDDDNDVAPRPENVLCEQKRQEIRTSGPREPLEILLRIWREDRDVKELVTGDYTVVDPALARAYGLLNANGRTFKAGVDAAAFNNDPSDDGSERRVVHIVDTDKNSITERNASLSAWPHQGILSTPSMLRRYPTTVSNRERTRARMVYERLLGVPVMKLAAFATPEIPPGQSLENLTWDTQPCIVCHTLLDPVAAQFNHWNGNGGNLIARRPCRNDGMRAPAFGFIALPGTDDENAGVFRPSLDDPEDCVVEDLATGAGAGANDTRAPERLRWLGDRVVEHPRFAYGVVLPLYEGLTGAPILSAPDALIDPDFEAKARAFATQQKELQSLVAAFRAGNQRFKPLVKAILLSQSFRAFATASDVDAGTARSLELLNVGAGALLTTPEVLDRKIISLTGLPWTHLRNPNARGDLVDDAFYAIFAGGIDSNTVTLRSRDPVAVRAAVARRLGNELSCVAVPQDFSIVDPQQRKLFSLVEAEDVPLDADGNVVAAADAKVLAQIRLLHQRLWNEEVIDEAEVAASHELFLAALQAMRAPSSGEATPAAIGGTCQAVSQFVRVPAGTQRPAYPATGTVVLDDVEHRRVSRDPDFTIRAWMAVTSSLLADGRFLFE